MGTKTDIRSKAALLDLANAAAYFTDYVLGFQ
jgi:hypothetical protein